MQEHNVSQSITYMLGQIDAKMTHMLASFENQKRDTKEELDTIHSRINAHGVRMERLERQHWKTAGILSLIPVTFSLAGLLIAYLNMK